jgi:hypothetical protein
MMERGEVIWNGVSRQNQEPRKRGSSVVPKESSVSADSSLTIPFSEGEWEFLGAASSESSFLDLCEASEMPKETADTVAQMLEQTSAYEHSRGETEISRNVRFWQDGFRAGYEAARDFSFGDLKRTREFDLLGWVPLLLVLKLVEKSNSLMA